MYHQKKTTSEFRKTELISTHGDRKLKRENLKKYKKGLEKAGFVAVATLGVLGWRK